MSTRTISDVFQGVSGAPPTNARVDVELAGPPLKAVSVLDVGSITLTVGSGISAVTGAWSVSIIDSDTHGQLIRVRETVGNSVVRTREFEVEAGGTTLDLAVHPESAPLKPYTERLTVESHINDTDSPHFGHTLATTDTPGFMSAADKTKLDGIEEGATQSGGGESGDYAPLSHVSSRGTAHGVATTSEAGFLSAADKSKLDGIAEEATAVTIPSDIGAATDDHTHSEYLSSAGGTLTGALTLHGAPTATNHAATKAYVDTAALGGITAVNSFNTRTGDVTLTDDDVEAALGFTPANSTHAHAEGDVTGLTAALAAKAASAHTHAEGDVTGLTAALAGKASSAHDHNTAYYTKAEVDALVEGETHEHPYLADTLYETGSFAATLTGWADALPAITVHYARIGNICQLSYTLSTVGTTTTSNASTLQSSAAVVPAALRPTFKGIGTAGLTDNGTQTIGNVQVDSSGNIKFGKNPSGVGGFTASGVKALGWFSLTYHLGA